MEVNMYTNTCTSNGWFWYCDNHDTHGNADVKEEAEAIALAHARFWADPDGCEITILNLKQGKQV